MLIIDACTPTPDRDSGSIDLLNYLRVLESLDYRVTFLPADLLYAGPYTRDLQDLGVECLYLPFAYSVEKVLRTRGDEFDVVMLMRLGQGLRYLKHVRAHCPRAKVIFNTVDLHYLRAERREATQSETRSRSIARRMKDQELEVVRGADSTIVISPFERELLAKEVPAARLHVIPLLREIPGRSLGYGGRRGLVFIGSFRHPPNVDAIVWFCECVWPSLRRRLPETELSIVGSYPSPQILGLKGHGVEVLGYVADIEPLFARARLTIAPLRYGAGLKGKVVTSLGYGVPCVVTPTAAEGLGLDDGQGILVAAESEAFAAAIVQLYESADEWERSSLAGLRAVTERFSVAANRPRIKNLLVELGLPA
ncbi:glycosyltransferase [Thiocapsa sp. C3-3m]